MLIGLVASSPFKFILWGIVLFILLISYRIWDKTTYQFTEDEIIVKVDLISKSSNNIPYSKLASINIKSGIWDKLFGTDTLLFNLNSSVDVQSSEVKLVLESKEANELRDKLNARIFSISKTYVTVDENGEYVQITEAEVERPSMIKISNFEIVLHSIIGQSSLQLSVGLFFFVYSIISAFYDVSGFVFGIMMFLTSSVIPTVTVILKYFNYKIYRVEDKITVESGAIVRKSCSFKINKVNTVKIKEPLIARCLGKAALEAEVVGLGVGEGSPLLCPCKNKNDVLDLFAQLLPEYQENFLPEIKQANSALKPMFIKNSIGFSFLLCVSLIVSYALGNALPQFLEYMYGILATVLIVGFVLIYGQIFLAQKCRKITTSENLIKITNGSYDLETVFVKYDKIQIVSVRSGLVAKKYGLGRAVIFQLTSQGFGSVKTGYFEVDCLKKIYYEVVERINDGRYDYKINYV